MFTKLDSVDNFFWYRLPSMLNKYFQVYESGSKSYFGIDSVVEPEFREISAQECRVIANSHSFVGVSDSLINFKVSIRTNARSIEEFVNRFPFENFHELNGKVNLNLNKGKVVIDAT